MSELRLARPEILRGMPRPLAVLEASAGTGKTWTLERLFVELVLVEKLRIEQILAVTFTERATAEMKMRVRQTFEALLRGELEPAPAGAPRDAVWTVDEEGRRRVERALAAFDTASISTIHSFCQRALTEYAFPGGRLLAQKRAEGRTAFGEAFREALRTSLSTDPALVGWLAAWQARRSLEELEELLWAALRARSRFLPPFDGPALAAAAAAVPPIESLGAGGIGPAFESIVNKNSRGKVVRTVENVLRAVDEHRARPSLPALLAALSLDKDDPLPYLSGTLDRAASSPEAERMRGALLSLAAAAVPFETGVVAALRDTVAGLFEANKRRAGEFDFDDMIAEVASAVGKPEGEPLVRALRSRFRAALIDEFQDTDDLQWGIFRKLFYESKEGHRLVVIGDPKQAIYSFRGADVTTYLGARGEMTLETPAVPLDTNFRATPAMVGAVNALLDQTGPVPVLGNGDIRYDRPVRAGRDDLALHPGPGGAGAVVPLRILQLQTQVQVKGTHVLSALGRRIAAEIRALLDGPGLLMTSGAPGERTERRIGPGDIYILTPKVRESRLIGECLDEARIPYSFYKEEGLLGSAEAEDFLDVLRALADPADPSVRMRALLTPFFGLALADLDGARDLPPSHPALRRLLDGRTLALSGRWPELFRLLLAGSGLVRRELATASGERSLTNFHHLAELLLQEAARRPGTLADLCRALASWTSQKALPEGEDVDMQRLPTADATVQVMTIHKAKGLEAPVVFLFGGLSAMRTGSVRFGHGTADRKRFAVAARKVPDDLLPLVEADERAEERRLLYVATTRAKGALYLPYTPEVPKTAKGARPGEMQESIKLFGPKCPYHPLNLRLRAMLAGPVPTGPGGPLLESLAFDLAASGAAARTTAIATTTTAPAAGPVLGGWSLPPEARETPPDLSGEFARLGSGRSGFFVTSYTGLKRLEGSYRAAGEKPAARAAEGTAGGSVPDGGGGPDLPGGIATGTMLHALLEEADPETLRTDRTPGEWASLPEVAPLLRRVLAAHQFDPSPEGPHSAAAARLVHAALTATLPLPDGGSVAGLGLVPGAVREMEFLYPVPEEGHPLLSRAAPPAADGPPFRIGRGCVTGFVDLLFSHDGRSWFVDWKSDVLPSYDAASLAAHVEKNYATQADLYTIALLRLLGVSDEAAFEGRFGGFLYVFLRGLDAASPGTGVYGRRASWEDVHAIERGLLAPARFAALENGGESSR